MRRSFRRRVESWLLLGMGVGLLGCPLLLDDDFTTVTYSRADAGPGCLGAACDPASQGLGGLAGAQGAAIGGNGGAGSAGSGNGGAAGSGGNAGSPGTAGSANAGGSASAGGTTSGAGNGGVGGAASAAGSGGQGGSQTACQTLEVNGSSYDAASNCVGIHGTSTLTQEPPTSLEVSYENGDPCFEGTIASTGWGAVYELTFAGDDDGDSFWDAEDAGVTGFEFAYRGSQPPSSLRVNYKDPSGVDNCYWIEPGTTAVPFSSAHPDCNASGPTVDSERLVELILAFPRGSQAYDVDFCVQIRALD